MPNPAFLPLRNEGMRLGLELPLAIIRIGRVGSVSQTRDKEGESPNGRTASFKGPDGI